MSAAPTNLLENATRTILVADPSFERGSALVVELLLCGFNVVTARTAWEAHQQISHRKICFALLEARFTDGDVFPLVEEIRRGNPGSRILVHSAFCNVALAVALTRVGATDVLPKPMEMRFVIQMLLGPALERGPVNETVPSPKSVRTAHIKKVYETCNQNVARAARKLALNRRTLQRMLKRTEMWL